MEEWWAHNPQVRGSKPLSETVLFEKALGGFLVIRRRLKTWSTWCQLSVSIALYLDQLIVYRCAIQATF